MKNRLTEEFLGISAEYDFWFDDYNVDEASFDVEWLFCYDNSALKKIRNNKNKVGMVVNAAYKKLSEKTCNRLMTEKLVSINKFLTKAIIFEE